MQYYVGALLLHNLSHKEVCNNIFVVTNLLNAGNNAEQHPDSMYDVDKEHRVSDIKIAELNLEAGRAAIALASFGHAVGYLQRGIEKLPLDRWCRHYRLSLELFSSAAEAEYCTGDIERMEKHCFEVVNQKDIPVEDKFRVYNVLIPSIGNRNRIQEAHDMTVSVLKEVGCTFPKRAQMLAVLRGLLKTKGAVKQFNPDTFVRYKEMNEETKIQGMRMLDRLTTFSYLLGTLLTPLAIFKMFDWTLEHGTSKFCTIGFATIGFLLSYKLGVSFTSKITDYLFLDI